MCVPHCLIPAGLTKFAAASAVLAVFSSTGRGDLFGSGENAFAIKFVKIGEPGNPADTTGDPNPAGAVPYTYRIGKYEISEDMIDKANTITAAEGNPLGITHGGRGPNKPATRVSWFEAAKFVNSISRRVSIREEEASFSRGS